MLIFFFSYYLLTNYFNNFKCISLSGRLIQPQTMCRQELQKPTARSVFLCMFISNHLTCYVFDRFVAKNVLKSLNLQALHQEKAPLSTHYGAITGLAELGQEV